MIKIWRRRKKRGFDAVKMKRDIRASISHETENMTFEQLKIYIQSKLNENKSKLIEQK